MKEVSFKSCWAAPWKDTYSTYGLTEDGKVYRWDGGCCAWLPLNMEVAFVFGRA